MRCVLLLISLVLAVSGCVAQVDDPSAELLGSGPTGEGEPEVEGTEQALGEGDRRCSRRASDPGLARNAHCMMF
jgi:hypothetical protein